MADTKKTADKPADKPANEPVKRSWPISNFFWGGLFMLLGVLFLLSNLGLVSIAWGEIWKLWPVLIIIAGLSILSLRGWVAGVVYGVAAVLIIGLTWATLTGNLAGSSNSGVATDEFSVSRDSDDVQRLAVDIDTGASSLDISSHQGDDMVSGRIESRLSDLKHESTTEGDTQRVALSQERNWQWFGPGSINDLDVRLNENIPLQLNIDAGASSIDADLSRVMLKSLKVDSGASSIDIKLGDKLDHSDVTIETGVSSLTIQVPEGVGIKLNLDSGLSSKDLPASLEQTDDNTYQTKDYDKSGKKITLHIDIGVSSFKLQTY